MNRNDQRVDEITENYDYLTDKINRKNHEEKIASNAENKIKFKDLERKFTTDLSALKRKTDSITNEGGFGDSGRREAIETKKNYEGKIDALRNQIQEIKFAADDALVDQQNSFKSSSFQQSKEFQKQTDDVAIDNSKVLSEQTSKSRIDKEKLIEDFRKEQNAQSKYMTDTLESKDKFVDRQLDESRRQFAETVNELNEDSLERLSKIQKEYATEQTKFVEKRQS